MSTKVVFTMDQQFQSIYELKLFMHNLQSTNTVKYKLTNAEYFSRNTKEYDKYLYQNVKYNCCGMAPENYCASFIHIKALNSVLQIVACDSEHSHAVSSQPRALPSVSFVDDGISRAIIDPEFSSTFRLLFEKKPFLSFRELQLKLDIFTKMTGASYIRRHTTKLPDDHPDSNTCIYHRLMLECQHAGSFKSRSVHGYYRKSKMMNCPSKIGFIYSGGGLRLMKFNLVHNHQLTISDSSSTKKSLNELRSCDLDYIEDGSICVDPPEFYNDPHGNLTSEFSNCLRPQKTRTSKQSFELQTVPAKSENVMQLIDQVWDTKRGLCVEEHKVNKLRDLISWWKKEDS